MNCKNDKMILTFLIALFTGYIIVRDMLNKCDYKKIELKKEQNYKKESSENPEKSKSEILILKK
jgi:hypothetical protein